MLEIWDGCWVNPTDVALVMMMGEDDGAVPSVRAALKSGPSVIRKFDTDKEARATASRIAQAVKEALG